MLQELHPLSITEKVILSSLVGSPKKAGISQGKVMFI